MTLTSEQADAIYTILVEECGEIDYADNRQRESFVRYMTNDDDYPKEFRFQGDLGFGGKCRLNGNRGGVPYVDFYPEDHTVARENMVDRANERIASLLATQAQAPNVTQPAQSLARQFAAALLSE